ncbi:START domain protein (macronuclear) [Tetrahymena thermophila SB210]|uniref:START domain protein n=1 Tax=Tetrahymena thermophila (strain SB210) TaxID=312017 RepID=Q22DN9_TETTS|nr:START domain protein [Tetrahymena thermophila SB210]EAR83415.1 START domain protein [Tetrahymena thermophila SB210]|eukprot:XP_001031078.1 START domain protein [Tetrahymena thermophila SB210]
MIENNYKEIIEKAIQENLQIRENQDGWKEQMNKENFKMSFKKYLDHKVNLSKIESILPVNLEKATQFYYERLDLQKLCRSKCINFENIETIDKDTYAFLFRTEQILVISGREIIGVQHKKQLNDNEVLIVRSNIPNHPKVTHTQTQEEVVRADQVVFSIFLTKIDDNSTKYLMYSLMDPKGKIPKPLIKQLLLKQYDVFKKELVELQKM